MYIDESKSILILIMGKYDFSQIFLYCDGVEVIETENIYEESLKLVESEEQENNIKKCKLQYANYNATVIMPQIINRTAYILLNVNLTLEEAIRKTIHEFVHLVHRCELAERMQFVDLYEIERSNDWEYYYYFDEFTTKKKELLIFYEVLYKNKKIADDNVYIESMKKTIIAAQNSQLDILQYMRNELSALAETIAYMKIFPDMFEDHFIEAVSKMRDIDKVVEILWDCDEINDFFVKQLEFKEVINILKSNWLPTINII